MTKRILFPTDFSHTGDAALEMATSLARGQDATLVIVHVQEPPRVYGEGDMYYGMLNPPPAELERMLSEVLPSDPQVAFEHHLVTGDPARGIVRLAKSEHVDMIVMGTHGRSGLTRLLMGSVAEAVVRRATCPVLTFKQPSNPLAEVT